MIVDYFRCSVGRMIPRTGGGRVRREGVGSMAIMAKAVVLFMLCIYLFASCPSVLGEVINVEPGVSIQKALKQASISDTVQVPSGLYRENLVISNGIHLKGVDTGGGRPIIDASGSGSAITLTADGITLEGFVARNARGVRAGGIKALSNRSTIRNNIIQDSDNGIVLINANYNVVEDNLAKDNAGAGIFISFYSNGNIILSNDVERNKFGVFMIDSKGNSITDNQIRNTSSSGVMCFAGCSENRIYSNAIANSTYFGIGINEASRNSFEENEIIDNRFGIVLNGSADGNVLRANRVSRSDIGIFIQGSDDNRIEGNLASDCSKGLFIDQTSHDNLLYGNYFAENGDADAYDEGRNRWDNGAKGNHYSSFDEESEGCSDSDSDGTCDSSYSIPGGPGVDHAPQVS